MSVHHENASENADDDPLHTQLSGTRDDMRRSLMAVPFSSKSLLSKATDPAPAPELGDVERRRSLGRRSQV